MFKINSFQHIKDMIYNIMKAGTNWLYILCGPNRGMEERNRESNKCMVIQKNVNKNGNNILQKKIPTL